MSKTYLGDGVYGEFDGFALILTTSNGLRDTNKIFMEPEQLEALLKFVAGLGSGAVTMMRNALPAELPAADSSRNPGTRDLLSEELDQL